MRLRVLAAWVSLGMLLLAPAAAQEKQNKKPEQADSGEAPATWYAQTVSRSDNDFRVTHFWSKGPYLRSETVVRGHKIVTIVRDERYYAYDTISGLGVAIRRAPAAIALDSPSRRPFGQEFDLVQRQGAEKVREDSYVGVTCDVYRVTDMQGRREVWITQTEPRLPVRVEIYRRAQSTTWYTDYVGWEWNLPIPDDYFQPDRSVTMQAFDLPTYLERSGQQGYVSPVPILYAELLRGPREQ